MKAMISVLALLVITGWAIVYFKYKEGGPFHLTLVIAIWAIMGQWFPGSIPFNKLKDRSHERRNRSLDKR